MKHPSLLLVPLWLFACADLEATEHALEAEAASEIVLPPPVPVPPPLVPSHNRLLWRNLSGVDGELWIVNDLGNAGARTAFSFAGRELLGTAGDRILWRNGANAELRVFDDSGVLGTTTYSVANPNPARFVPRSIALATNACWSKTSQDYYVLWDDTLNDEVAIQLIDNTGFQRRVDFVNKPVRNMPALWFGIAADGFEQLMLRSGVRDGFLFRVSWSSTPPTGWVITPTAKAVKSRPGHEPHSTGRVVASSIFFRGTWDQVLFIELNAALQPTPNAKLELYQPTTNMPPLLNPILSGNPPVVYTYTGTSGLYAQTFTGNPNLCP